MSYKASWKSKELCKQYSLNKQEVNVFKEHHRSNMAVCSDVQLWWTEMHDHAAWQLAKPSCSGINKASSDRAGHIESFRHLQRCICDVVQCLDEHFLRSILKPKKDQSATINGIMFNQFQDRIRSFCDHRPVGLWFRESRSELKNGSWDGHSAS